jgi:hypothetical protein
MKINEDGGRLSPQSASIMYTIPQACHAVNAYGPESSLQIIYLMHNTYLLCMLSIAISALTYSNVHAHKWLTIRHHGGRLNGIKMFTTLFHI